MQLFIFLLYCGSTVTQNSSLCPNTDIWAEFLNESQSDQGVAFYIWTEMGCAKTNCSELMTDFDADYYTCIAIWDAQPLFVKNCNISSNYAIVPIIWLEQLSELTLRCGQSEISAVFGHQRVQNAHDLFNCCLSITVNNITNVNMESLLGQVAAIVIGIVAFALICVLLFVYRDAIKKRCATPPPLPSPTGAEPDRQ